MIRVHTTVFIAFLTVHTNTPRIRCEEYNLMEYGRSSSLSLSKDARDIPKFSFHSSGTTICETRLPHHALVRPGRIQNLLALASRVFEPNRRYEVPEKAISRIRIVLLLWETNKRLKRARFNSKQAIKNRSIFCSAMFVLIFGFGARACYSITWYSWRHRLHFYPDPTVHTSTKDIRIRFIHFRERFQTYTDSVDPIRVLMGTEALTYQKVYGFERIRVSVDEPSVTASHATCTCFEHNNNSLNLT